MEDVDYRVIPKQQLSDTERIEVVYFFYYGCQWCYQFEPYVDDWLKKKPVDVSFRRVPALAQYQMGRADPRLLRFRGDESAPARARKGLPRFSQGGRDLQSEGTLFDWVAKQGVKRDRFEEVFRSDAVTTRMTDSRALTNSFEVESTPSVAVDGRYITSSGMTDGVAQLMSVVEQLIQMVRAERRGK